MVAGKAGAMKCWVSFSLTPTGPSITAFQNAAIKDKFSGSGMCVKSRFVV